VIADEGGVLEDVIVVRREGGDEDDQQQADGDGAVAERGAVVRAFEVSAFDHGSREELRGERIGHMRGPGRGNRGGSAKGRIGARIVRHKFSGEPKRC